MNPGDEYKPKTIYSEPNPPADVQQVTIIQPQSANTTASAKSVSSKGPLIAAIVVTVIVLVVIIGVVIANSGSNKKAADSNAGTDASASLLQPAQPLELEQTNSALNQDLSGLDDEKDFPASGLEDKTLGL